MIPKKKISLAAALLPVGFLPAIVATSIATAIEEREKMTGQPVPVNEIPMLIGTTAKKKWKGWIIVAVVFIALSWVFRIIIKK